MAKLAPSLQLLFNEINARWPKRDKRTDGWYASPKVRKSKGHNPGRGGWTHAIDVDDDGIDEKWIINNIYKGGNVLWYIIWNRTLYSNTYDWKPRHYSGSNPHTDHMHIEIYQTITAEFFKAGWGIAPGSSGMGGAPFSGIGEAIVDASRFVYSAGFGLRDYRAFIDTEGNHMAQLGEVGAWGARNLRNVRRR